MHDEKERSRFFSKETHLKRTLNIGEKMRELGKILNRESLLN